MGKLKIDTIIKIINICMIVIIEVNNNELITSARSFCGIVFNEICFKFEYRDNRTTELLYVLIIY